MRRKTTHPKYSIAHKSTVSNVLWGRPGASVSLKATCLLALALLCASCGQLPHRPSAQDAGQDVAGAATAVAPAAAARTDDGAPAAAGPPAGKGRQRIIELGSDEFVATMAPEPLTQSKRGTVTLNFQATDLREFIKVILNDALNENYYVDERVAGKVTIETARPVRKQDLLALLEDILALHGAAITREEGLYRIIPKDQAVKGRLALGSSRQISPGHSVRIIPLKFIAAQEMQKILEPFVADAGELRIDRKRNLVIVSGSQQEIAVVQETVDVFDVDWLRGMSVGLYPLDYVEPKVMKAELDAIIGAMEVDNAAADALLGGLARTVALDRIQSILLISSTTAALWEVEIWIHRLDQPGKSEAKRLYVYTVQNAKAVELADILGHVFGSAAMTAAPGTPAEVELAPGLDPVEINPVSRPGEGGQPGSGRLAGSAASSVAAGGLALTGGQSVEIIADDVRNALVILATPQDYRMVEAALAKLDVVPLQVLIEASILEVSLKDDLNYGVEWFLRNSADLAGITEGRATLDLGDAGITALSGFSYTLINSAEQVRFALNALEQESEVKVLSSPSLMVLDNQSASINVGNEIPVPVRQSVSNINPDAPTVNEIQFRQTGVTLTVTPRVNNSGLVTMEVKQEVSNAVSTTTSEVEAPTIQQRQLESTVAVNSGETITLGGLIQETDTLAEGGVPFIRRLPVLGRLFGQTRDEARRTELLVLITPRVIRSRNEAREVTEEFRRKLRGLAPATWQSPGEPSS